MNKERSEGLHQKVSQGIHKKDKDQGVHEKNQWVHQRELGAHKK